MEQDRRGECGVPHWPHTTQAGSAVTASLSQAFWDPVAFSSCGWLSPPTDPLPDAASSSAPLLCPYHLPRPHHDGVYAGNHC